MKPTKGVNLGSINRIVFLSFSAMDSKGQSEGHLEAEPSLGFKVQGYVESVVDLSRTSGLLGSGVLVRPEDLQQSSLDGWVQTSQREKLTLILDAFFFASDGKDPCWCFRPEDCCPLHHEAAAFEDLFGHRNGNGSYATPKEFPCWCLNGYNTLCLRHSPDRFCLWQSYSTWRFSIKQVQRELRHWIEWMSSRVSIAKIPNWSYATDISGFCQSPGCVCFGRLRAIGSSTTGNLPSCWHALLTNHRQLEVYCVSDECGCEGDRAVGFDIHGQPACWKIVLEQTCKAHENQDEQCKKCKVKSERMFRNVCLSCWKTTNFFVEPLADNGSGAVALSKNVEIILNDNDHVLFKPLASGVIIPKEGKYEGDAGVDIALYEDVEVRDVVTVPLKFSMVLPSGYYATLLSRSSAPATTKVLVSTSPIDTGYRGEIFVTLATSSPFPVIVPGGTYFFQMVFSRNPEPRLRYPNSRLRPMRRAMATAMKTLEKKNGSSPKSPLRKPHAKTSR
jgi:dUTPase